MTGGNPSVVAAPDPDAVRARAELDRATGALSARIDEAVSAWERTVEAEVIRPFAARVRGAADAHAALAASLPAPEAPDRQAAWLALAAGIERAASEVWMPLMGTAEMDTLRHRTAATLEALREEADALPESVRVPEDMGRYAPDPSDGLLVRLGKAVRRGRFGLRAGARRFGNGLRALVRRPPARIDAPLRTVPLRHHARAAVDGPAARSLHEAGRELEGRLRTVASALGDVAETWLVDILPSLDATDRAAWHVPGDVPLPGGDGEIAGPDDDPWPEAVRGVADLALRTTEALEALADEAAALTVRLPGETAWSDALEQAAAVGGTFLLPDPGRPVPRAEDEDGSLHRDDRIALAHALATFRTTLAGVESGTLRIVAGGMLELLARSRGQLREQLEAIRGQVAEGLRTGRTDGLGAVHTEAVASVARLIRELPQPERVEEAFRRASSRAWASVSEAIAALPEDLVLPVPQRRGVRHLPVPVRSLAEQAFERNLAPRILALHPPVQRELVRIWNESEQVQHVVDAAFAAAIEELAPAGETAAAAQADSARKLLEDGIRRASEALDEGFGSLAGPWKTLTRDLHRMLVEDWRHLYRTIQTEDFLARQWLGFRSRVTRRSGSLRDVLARAGAQTMQHIRILVRSLRMRASRLVRLGKAAVGAAEAASEDRIRTLDAVTSVADLYDRLPLIYRKLFTLAPLAEPGLAVNRGEDLAAVSDAFERWKGRNAPGVFVAHAGPGSGRTSFLNLVGRSLNGQAQIVRLPVEDRIPNEETLVELVTTALALDAPEEASFASLERRLQSTEMQTTVVLIDDLEHALLQTPGGTRLIEDLLLFFARTDGSVFWCIGMSDLAWRFLQKTRSAVSGLAVDRALTPWDRGTVQEVVLERHRRAGMPVRFLEPTSPSPILKQRLKRARTPEAVQRLLREEFFDALFRSAGQDPALALHGWVRCARFEEDADVLTMRPFEPLSFAFLNRMDNDRAFMLRAFLVHHTLSPEDLALIFRSPEDRTLANLETLLALGLLEAVDADAPATYVVPGTRYRLRRLVQQPVRRFLTERHFVY